MSLEPEHDPSLPPLPAGNDRRGTAPAASAQDDLLGHDIVPDPSHLVGGPEDRPGGTPRRR
ncbi:MAG TPA: hypothetical protein VGM03_16410, partial [Phycisphaerae bacterium]